MSKEEGIKRKLSSMPNNETINEIKDKFTLSGGELKKVITNFHREMKNGLLCRKSSLKMIPTYVKKPKGTEKGKFFALDLGGTNFRVILLELDGKRGVKTALSQKFTLKEKHIAGTGRELFDFIAKCIKAFMKKYRLNILDEHNVGFTFSFPVKKIGIASGILVCWTKGFRASGVEGKDVVKLLNASLERIGLKKSKIIALANDTVSTLIAKSYEDKNCDIGVILGTGTNACYNERLSNINKCKFSKPVSKRMVINIEWGNFNKLRRTNYDKELDRISKNPGEQILEKMVSGMYLGEIVRLVLKDLIKKKALLNGKYIKTFKKQNAFKTEYTSLIVSDNSKNLISIKKLLKKFKITNSTYKDRKLVKEVSRVIAKRAARLSAAAIIAVTTKIDPSLSQKHTVAIDGTVYEKHPGFANRIKLTLKEILKAKAQNIKLSLTKDASGKGAAILAAAQAG